MDFIQTFVVGYKINSRTILEKKTIWIAMLYALQNRIG